jgi:hypothetical protein
MASPEVRRVYLAMSRRRVSLPACVSFNLVPPLFQQTPRLQALDGKPVHLSLEKLTFRDVLQSEPLRRSEE